MSEFQEIMPVEKRDLVGIVAQLFAEGYQAGTGWLLDIAERL